MWPRKLQLPSRVVAIVSVFAACCFAQFSGSIQGTVQDPAGAVVPNAKVQLKNTGTGVATSTQSDNEGNYHFVSLAPGSYQITAEASGFSATTVSFNLTTGENLNLPVAMKVAAATQTVE